MVKPCWALLFHRFGNGSRYPLCIGPVRGPKSFETFLSEPTLEYLPGVGEAHDDDRRFVINIRPNDRFSVGYLDVHAEFGLRSYT